MNMNYTVVQYVNFVSKAKRNFKLIKNMVEIEKLVRYIFKYFTGLKKSMKMKNTVYKLST